jgi:oligopeptide/dipeptide ABC transporter ATP-binding protein
VSTPLLEIRDLRVTFVTPEGEARAVDGVDLAVAAGETVGLVGESGCGKSVTALAVLRLLEREARIGGNGSVTLAGRELLSLPKKDMRHVRGQEIALVFQEPGSALNPVLTIGDQVAEALTAHRRMPAREAWSRAVDMLRQAGIPDAEVRAKQYPHQLSGGLRQRALIAMALVCGPKLLIADEPTTALDVTIQAEVLELLARLQRQLGMAVLLITHNLALVADTTERVYVMYAGQVVEHARTLDLFERPAHPYTEGLLAAIPLIDRPVARLAQIPGQVPPATDWPGGCRFHPRCPYAWDRCRAELPPLLDAGAGHQARCWLLVEPARRAAAHEPDAART